MSFLTFYGENNTFHSVSVQGFELRYLFSEPISVPSSLKWQAVRYTQTSREFAAIWSLSEGTSQLVSVTLTALHEVTGESRVARYRARPCSRRSVLCPFDATECSDALPFEPELIVDYFGLIQASRLSARALVDVLGTVYSSIGMHEYGFISAHIKVDKLGHLTRYSRCELESSTDERDLRKRQIALAIGGPERTPLGSLSAGTMGEYVRDLLDIKKVDYAKVLYSLAHTHRAKDQTAVELVQYATMSKAALCISHPARFFFEFC